MSSRPPPLTISDEDRIDPSKAERWVVTAGGFMTVVLATCREEARVLGAFWIERHRGRAVRGEYVRARLASDEDVDRWLALRRQEREWRQGVPS